MSIFKCIIDEGAFTYVIALFVWRDLVSLEHTVLATLLKESVGHYFKPHGNIMIFPIEIGCKIIMIMSK